MRRGSGFRALGVLTAVSVLLLTAAKPAGAINVNAIWPELGLPGFRVIPFFTERLEYQSNVLLAPRNELDDLISRSIPGLIVELPFGRHRLDLVARAEFLKYLSNRQLDTRHYFLLGKLGLNFPGGLNVRVREEFAKTSDPPGTELTGRISSTTNTVGSEVEYALVQRFSLAVGYTFTHVSFDDTVTELNRNEHLAGVTGFWKMTGKSDLLANVSYGVKTFENDSTRDAERFLGTVGVRGELTSRLSSTFRIGYEHRATSGHTVNTLISSGDWVFVPTARTRLSLLTQRSLEESVFQSNITYTATAVTFLAEQRFGPKVTANGRVFVGLNEYPNKDQDVDGFHRRTDRVMGAAFGIDYQIQRWLAVGAEYKVSDRKSNFSGFDYTDHVIGVKVTLSL